MSESHDYPRRRWRENGERRSSQVEAFSPSEDLRELFRPDDPFLLKEHYESSTDLKFVLSAIKAAEQRDRCHMLAAEEFYRAHCDEDVAAEELVHRYAEYRLKFAFQKELVLFDQVNSEEWVKKLCHPEEKNKKHAKVAKGAINACNGWRTKWATNRESCISQAKVELVVSGGVNESSASGVDDSIALEQAERTLFVRNIPLSVGAEKVLELLSSLDGSPMVSLTEPILTGKTPLAPHRLAWVVFSTPDACTSSLSLLQQQNIGSWVPDVVKGRVSREARKYTPLFFSPSESSELVRVLDEVARSLDESRGVFVGSEKPEAPWMDESLDLESRLLLVAYYLRNCHFYCPFAGESCEDREELVRRCGGVLAFVDPLNDAAARLQLDKTKQRAKMVLETPAFPRVSPSQSSTTAMRTLCVLALMEKEGEGRWKCKICPKKFRAERFIFKHVYTKHAEELEKEKSLRGNLAWEMDYKEEFCRQYLKIQRLVRAFSSPPPPPPPILHSHDRDADARGVGRGRGKHFHPFRRPPVLPPAAVLAPPLLPIAQAPVLPSYSEVNASTAPKPTNFLEIDYGD